MTEGRFGSNEHILFMGGREQHSKNTEVKQ